MPLAVAAVLFDFQLIRSTPLIFGGRVVFAFASLTNKLNDIPGHRFLTFKTQAKRKARAFPLPVFEKIIQ